MYYMYNTTHTISYVVVHSLPTLHHDHTWYFGLHMTLSHVYMCRSMDNSSTTTVTNSSYNIRTTYTFSVDRSRSIDVSCHRISKALESNIVADASPCRWTILEPRTRPRTLDSDGLFMTLDTAVYGYYCCCS